jgi:hypothetical protein
MSKTGIHLISFILTYGITRIGYRLANYDPWAGHSFLVGLAIDASLWITIFLLIEFLLNKFIATKVGTN